MLFLALSLLSTAFASDLFYYNLTVDSGVFKDRSVVFASNPRLPSDVDDGVSAYNETSKHFQTTFYAGYSKYLSLTNGGFDLSDNISEAVDVEINDQGYLSISNSEVFKICNTFYDEFYELGTQDYAGRNCTEATIKAERYMEIQPNNYFSIFGGNAVVLCDDPEFNNSFFMSASYTPVATNDSATTVSTKSPFVYNYETKEVRSTMSINHSFSIFVSFDENGRMEYDTCSELPFMVNDEGYLTYNGTTEFAISSWAHGRDFSIRYPYKEGSDYIKAEMKFLLSDRLGPFDGMSRNGEGLFGDCAAPKNDKFMDPASRAPQIPWANDADVKGSSDNTSTAASETSTDSDSDSDSVGGGSSTTTSATVGSSSSSAIATSSSANSLSSSATSASGKSSSSSTSSSKTKNAASIPRTGSWALAVALFNFL